MIYIGVIPFLLFILNAFRRVGNPKNLLKSKKVSHQAKTRDFNRTL